MALVTRAASASSDASSQAFADQISGLMTGEAIDCAAPCYIKASDGLVYMSNGTAANEAAKVDGFAPRSVPGAGYPITLVGKGGRFSYGSGLTIGADYFVAATAGRLDTAATTGGLVAVARAITATDIRITRDA